LSLSVAWSKICCLATASVFLVCFSTSSFLILFFLILHGTIFSLPFFTFLPSCGSVFGYGSDTNSAEIRVRIVTELVLNDDYYLDNKSLLKGTCTDGGNSTKLPKIYAQ
jgi:hypothetical protein